MAVMAAGLESTVPPTDTSAASHYADLDDPDSQTSPEVVRASLRGWLAATHLDGPVLDVGTGIGSNLDTMRHHATALGTEISATAAVRARAATGAPITVADGARLPLRSGSCGAVVCTEVLEHVDDPGLVFAEVARVLRPGGLAYVTTPNYANLCGVHKLLADRRSGRHDWNPWGAHEGGYEGFMTGRRLWAAARPHLELVRVRGLDHGQALTGRFRILDRLAWTAPGQTVLRRLLPRMARSEGLLAWHAIHVELVLRKG